MKRYLVFFCLFSILATLIFILVQAKSPSEIDHAIQAYHTLKTYQNIHISGNELRMSYLAVEKDDIDACSLICLKEKKCIAANYYKGNPEQNHAGQCWLFTAIDPAKIDLNQPCCTLVIKADQRKAIKMLDAMKRK